MRISQMFDDRDDNTWVFAGGRAVQGSFSDIAGARNYIGEFEEYVRFTLVQKSGDVRQQRHTISTAYHGQDIAEALAGFAARIAPLDPRAVVYMAGREDWMRGTAGVEDFKVSLRAFLEKCLALKGGMGFAVILSPLAQRKRADNEKAELYAKATVDVVSSFPGEMGEQILLVDCFAQTNTEEFKEHNLCANGMLNARGHLEIARQLASATCGLTLTFPSGNMPPIAVDYPDDLIPAEGKDAFRYDNVAFRGMASAGQKPGQLPQMPGMQPKLADKMASEKPMTWIFMGDSITHGAGWLYGYDPMVQSFEKFLKDDLGRVKDVVVNTGNSGSTTVHTVNNLWQRLKKYEADVVSIMLGTNDAGGHAVPVEDFKRNMDQIARAIEEKGAVPVLRTPLPNAAKNNGEFLPDYVRAVKEVAKLHPQAILVDQFALWERMILEDNAAHKTTELFERLIDKDVAMKVHPGPRGHLWMTHQFLWELGLWSDKSAVCKLCYK